MKLFYKNLLSLKRRKSLKMNISIVDNKMHWLSVADFKSFPKLFHCWHEAFYATSSIISADRRIKQFIICTPCVIVTTQCVYCFRFRRDMCFEQPFSDLSACLSNIIPWNLRKHNLLVETFFSPHFNSFLVYSKF